MDLEEKAQTKGKVYIPERLTEAYFVTQGISWQDYRTMPKHLIEEIQLLWHLEAETEKYKPPKK